MCGARNPPWLSTNAPEVVTVVGSCQLPEMQTLSYLCPRVHDKNNVSWAMCPALSDPKSGKLSMGSPDACGSAPWEATQKGEEKMREHSEGTWGQRRKAVEDSFLSLCWLAEGYAADSLGPMPRRHLHETAQCWEGSTVRHGRGTRSEPLCVFFPPKQRKGRQKKTGGLPSGWVLKSLNFCSNTSQGWGSLRPAGWETPTDPGIAKGQTQAGGFNLLWVQDLHLESPLKHGFLVRVLRDSDPGTWSLWAGARKLYLFFFF